MTEESSESPSFLRRQALRKAATIPRLVQPDRPLSGYFAMAESLHSAFLQAVEKRQIDAAYVYGLRLASLALELLPKHPDWKQPACRKDKRRLGLIADKTIQQMEVLKQRMDAEEILRQQRQRQEEERRQQQEEEKRRAAEAERQKQVAIQQRLAQEREHLLENHRKEQAAALEMKKKKKQQSIQQSALAKLQAMQPRAEDSLTSSQSQSTVENTTTTSSTIPEHLSDKVPEASAFIPPSQQTDNSTASVEKPMLPDNAELTSPTIHRTLTPRSSKEQATIDLLYRAIKNQEKRVEDIESKQIPQLITITKAHLKRFRSEEEKSAAKINQDKSNPYRQAALQCLARKKRLERQAEASKAAIFQMETQIFMLENAMEDRLVQSTLKEASRAMSDLQKLAGIETPVEDFAQQLSESLAADTSEIALDPEEEDDLLQELQSLIGENSNVEMSSGLSKENADVLALPVALTSPLPSTGQSDTSYTTSDSVRNLLKAVLG